MTDIIKSLPNDKIKINWNKNPIKMNDFLGFLTVDVVKSHDHLGSDNGWTKYNGENNLIIGGGWVNGVEYLDSLQYKRSLSNPYNNYVNPFFLFEILNEDGRKFFLDYFEEDIKKELKKIKDSIKNTKKTLKSLNAKLKEEEASLKELGVDI